MGLRPLCFVVMVPSTRDTEEPLAPVIEAATTGVAASGRERVAFEVADSAAAAVASFRPSGLAVL